MLEAAQARNVDRLRLRLDSELIVFQMSGRYRVKNEALRPHFERAMALSRGFKGFEVTHVPRARNAHADRLVNRALDNRGPSQEKAARLPDSEPPRVLPVAPLEDRPQRTLSIDLLDALRSEGPDGVRWSTAADELNVNLLIYDNGQGIEAHRNYEVEVLIVALMGEGVIEIDGESRPFRTGEACVIPKGAERALRSGGGPFGYLTCHRRREGLSPS